MKLTENETNKGWTKIFSALPLRRELDKHGMCRISAKEIKKYSDREPRLMSKFDSRDSRPELLKKHGLTILPTSNGEYVLLQGDGYCKVPQADKYESYDPSPLLDLQTIPWKEGIRSESQAIDSFYMASALRTVFGDPSLQLTIRGRLRSRGFNFRFLTSKREETIAVEGVQIEVDAGYEGKKKIVLLEAKSGSITDFLIRQLYYPYRECTASGVTKEVIPALLVYSNRLFSLYKITFADLENYNSAQVADTWFLSLDEKESIPTLKSLLETKTQPLPANAPFPQADDLEKVILTVEMLTGGPATKFDIAQKFDVALDPRQGDYYGNAAVWLGLAERMGKENPGFRIAKLGSAFVGMTRIKRLVELARIVCNKPIFSDVTRDILSGIDVETAGIAKLIEKTLKEKLSEDTKQRRAVTVKSWVSWLAKQLPS
jgi:hypothetical protein